MCPKSSIHNKIWSSNTNPEIKSKLIKYYLATCLSVIYLIHFEHMNVFVEEFDLFSHPHMPCPC